MECRKTEARYETQYVAQADWERVQTGASVEAVYRLICKPGDRLLGSPSDEQTSLEYFVVMTEPVFHDSTCAGRILAEGGIVVAKEIMCE